MLRRYEITVVAIDSDGETTHLPLTVTRAGDDDFVDLKIGRGTTVTLGHPEIEQLISCLENR